MTRRLRFLGVSVICSLVLSGPLQPSAWAWEEADFEQKPSRSYVVSGDDVVGRLRAHRIKKGDTLLDVARHYSLGHGEIIESNPGLDVWLPPPGAIAMLPTSWVLPCCARTGLVINIPEMRLYYFRPLADGSKSTEVITYAVGLGRDEWQTPRGKFKIRSKTEDPTWVIPESIRAERIEKDGDARRSIPGGAEDNPLGKHRLALTLPSYAIHGTHIPWGVGMQVSHGCIRLYPEDVARLFPQVPVGTPGEFLYQPVKIGRYGDDVYAEVTSDIYGLTPGLWREAGAIIERLGVADRIDQDRLMEALQNPVGFPVKISRDRLPTQQTRIEGNSDAGVSAADTCETRDD
jgi:L,D-transpeptidase ErfK/SrfK